MRIGVDFDNTIVCYDDVFHRAARAQNLIPADVPPTKTGVRDYLRAAGREDDWTALQGYIYGARMDLASPYPGVADFFRRARESGVDLCVVSHKTRHPYKGPRYDLHDAALGWLAAQGFFAEGIGLDRRCVFLELTKDAKLARIAALGCDYFIDDLPELLCEPAFPAATRRVLFDPNGDAPEHPSYRRARSWRDIADDVFERAMS